jgi:hypothetical protein
MKANHRTTTIDSYGELYDEIQIGEHPDCQNVKIGDVFNNRWIMVNSFHLAPLSELDKPLRYYEATVLNTATGETFEEQFICPETPAPDLEYEKKHLKTKELHMQPFDL